MAVQLPTSNEIPCVFPDPIWINTARFLSLKDLSQLACVNHVLHALANCPSVIAQSLSVDDLPKLTDNFVTKYAQLISPKITPAIMSRMGIEFLKKYFRFLTVDHMQACNFAGMNRKDLIALTPDFRDPVCNTALFLHSCDAMKCLIAYIQDDDIPNEVRTIWESQRRYFHLLTWDGLFEWDHLIKSPFSGVPSERIDEIKQTYEDCLLFINNRNVEPPPFEAVSEQQVTMVTFQVDLYRLALYQPQQLENIATALWTEYDPSHLDAMSTLARDAGNMYKYIPFWLFKGFCNVIARHANAFGRFNYWYMTNDHLIAWNATFRNRTIERINIALISDVTPDTLNAFVAIIRNVDAACSVRVDWMHAYGQLRYPHDAESLNIFQSRRAEILSRNPNWHWEVVDRS